MFNIPVLQVLAWSSDAVNPVEAEYIITEKAPGVRLSSLQLRRGKGLGKA